MKILLFTILFLLVNSGNAQIIFLEEDFENGGSIPNGWTTEIIGGTAEWDYIAGGATPSGQTNPAPPTAHSGNFNARFFKSAFDIHETFLISPAFSLEFAQKPKLSFWYAQFEQVFPGLEPNNNKFNLYYRSPEEGNNWTLIKEYHNPTTNWVYDSIPLPDSIRFSSIQIGFKGISATLGYSTCIDDIKIIETDTISKYVTQIYATQPNTNIIPTGSTNNPILRLRFPVQGNDGKISLDSLSIIGLLNTNEAVSENGVKLYYTTTEDFSTKTQIGSASTFENNVANFTNINKELPSGNSYIWVTFDIPDDPTHEFKNFAVDAKIAVNGIKISNTYFPRTELNPSGIRQIKEAIFIDGFETDKGWLLTGEFERDLPQGLGGSYQNSDPENANSGDYIIGTDLTGLGSHQGDYEANLDSNEYAAISPTFNGKYYKNIDIQHYKWLNSNFGDLVSIDFSTDNQKSWNTAWESINLVSDDNWKFQIVSASNIIDRESNIRLRYGLGPTSNSQFLSGWNIDDVAVVGTFVEYDAGITQLIAPIKGCDHIAPEPVEVVISNLGFNSTNDTIPVEYSIDNGSTWTRDTLFQSIPKDGSVSFTFNENIDISTPDNYTIIVRTTMKGDEYNKNNALIKEIISPPIYPLPYIQDFEIDNDFWIAGGKYNTWEYGSPGGTIISNAYSGSNCLATNLDGDYLNNDTSWIESPCFDFTGIEKPIFECMLFANAEVLNDGLALQYSVDGGFTWQLVPSEGSFNWNWYNNANIPVLGTEGWDNIFGNWFKTRQILPNNLANVNGVKFRFLFASNSSIVKEGFAIDDIRIYEAPTDAGIAIITNPVTSCELSKEETITVGIKNYGIRPINSNDSLFATVVIDHSTTLIDTFLTTTPIAVGDIGYFSFSQKHNMFNKKWYHLKAFTEVKGDTAFYESGIYNDTIIDSVYVKGEPYYSLGPDIGTIKPDTLILDGGTHQISGQDFGNYFWKYFKLPTDSIGANQKTFIPSSFPTGENFMTISIEITNDSSCSSVDTIQIIKSQTDIGVTAFSGISDACIDAQTPSLQVTIKNFTSSYTIVAGTQLAVGYKINNEPEYIETFNLGSDLTPGSSINYPFSVYQPIFSEVGNNEIKIFTSINADLDYSNDTINDTFVIYPIPETDIGPDNIFTLQADTIVFDAGEGFLSYEWQDGIAFTRNFAVDTDTSAEYSVKVESANGCGYGYDTVNVISDNWIADSLISPINSCSPSYDNTVSFLVINKSPNNYPAGFQIQSQYIFDGIVETEVFSLPTPLNAYDSIELSFSTLVDMPEIKTYNLEINISPTKDINNSDNNITNQVKIWGVKTIDLGYDTIPTQRADTILLDAGDFYESYLWQDGSTNSTFQITDKISAKYWVRVSDYNNCPSSSDTVNIFSSNIALEELSLPISSCDIASISTIKFNIHNVGEDVIPEGEVIDFHYKVNNEEFKSQKYAIPFDIEPNQTKQVSLVEEFSFVADNEYSFVIYSNWDKDMFPDNDTLNSQISQLISPDISLGDDIYTTQADTVELSVSFGYTNYTWQDGSRDYRFLVKNNYSDTYWVRVGNALGCFTTDSVNIYTTNINIASINNLNSCELNIKHELTINIQLYGQDTLKVGDIIEAQYELKGEIINETIVLTDTLTSARTLPYTFSTPLAIDSIGNYTIKCSISIENEASNESNTLESNFRIGSYPVDLGEDITTSENSIILDAGAGFAEYLWDNATDLQTRTVTTSGNYSVTTTDVNNCTDTDSINVLFINPQYTINEIHGLADSCKRIADENISFTLYNAGNDTLYVDDILTISYLVNSANTIEEIFTLTNQLDPGESINIPFSTKLNISSIGEYYVVVNASINSTTSTNDTTINTWGIPDVNLGEDISSVDESVILDAGSGFASYIWSTDETTQTITVINDGTYSVTVSSNNGCENSDAIKVHFIPVALAVIDFTNPLEGCEPLNNQAPSIMVKNAGTKVIPEGTTVILGYKTTYEDRVNESITFASNIDPDREFPHDFEEDLNLINSGNQKIQFYINVEGIDVDTADYTILVKESPVFSFESDTIEVEAYPYELDPGVTAASYLWNTGATTPTLTITENGSYSLIATSSNTCIYGDTVYVEWVNSINDEWGKQISIYPNPATNHLNISIPESLNVTIVEIIDAHGKAVIHNENAPSELNYDISNWSQGVYFVRIFNNEHYALFKIIVQ